MPDETTKFESSQALFCAFVDLVGRDKSTKLFFQKGNFANGKMVYETYQDFVGIDKKGKKLSPSKVQDKQLITNRKNIEIAFKETDTPDMDLNAMETFLMGSKPWFHSSVIIAIKLISDLHSKTAGGISLSKFGVVGKPQMQKIDYVRGDKAIMQSIEAIWRICRDNEKEKASVKGMGLTSIPFLDVNKWSPADIYYASPKAAKEIAKALKEAEEYEGYFYSDLNELVLTLMKSGDLLGVSLKKQTDPNKVQIKLVNFSVSTKGNLLDEIYYDSHDAHTKKLKKSKRDGKAGSIGKVKWKGGEVPANTNTPSRDFNVRIKGGGNIQMRHDPSGNSWKVDFKDKGAGARAGSVTSYKIFCQIWALVDASTAKTFKTQLEAGRAAFDKATKNPVWTKKKAQLMLIPFKGPKMTNATRFKSSAYDFQKGEISALTFMNKILPTLVDWFSKGGKAHIDKKNKFVRLLFQYVTSRHPLSGKFVIAK